MAKYPLPIVGDYQKVKQVGINPEKTINLYAVNLDDQKTAPALVCTQGAQFQLKFPDGDSVRGMYSDLKNNYLYVICSEFVYKLDVDFNIEQIGTLNTTIGFVKITQNNADQIYIIDGKDGFIYNDSTNVFSQVTYPVAAFPPSYADFMDTYFISPQGGTNNWYISNQSDGTTWSSGDYTQLQTRPDNVVACVVLKRQLFVFGQRTTEIWIDQGQLNFPFVRDNTVSFEFGVAAIGSIIQNLDLLFWLSRNDKGTSSIMMSDGGLPRPISTTDIDQEITDYMTVSDAIAYFYKIDGHLFYSINFPSANYFDPVTNTMVKSKTWTYDVTTNFWFNQAMEDGTQYFISSAAFFNGNTYGGHGSQPILYLMSGQIYTNDFVTVVGNKIVVTSNPITRTRITHRINLPTYEAMMVNFLETDIVQGVGAVNDPGSNPTLFLYVSFDVGQTYEKVRKGVISALGNTVGYRTKFWNCGINKDFVFKLICYDPIDLTIRGAAFDYDVVGN